MTSVTGDAPASSATFDLTAKWIVSRLADKGFGRLEAAAEFLRNIPNTGEKIDIEKAKERGWKTDFKVAFSDIAEGDGHMKAVISAIDAMVDTAPSIG